MDGLAKIESLVFKCKKDPDFLNLIYDFISEYDKRKQIQMAPVEEFLENFYSFPGHVFWDTDIFIGNVSELANLFLGLVDSQSPKIEMEPMSIVLVDRYYHLSDEWCKSELRILPQLYQILSDDLKELVAYRLNALIELSAIASEVQPKKIHYYSNLVQGLFFHLDNNFALYSYKDNE